MDKVSGMGSQKPEPSYLAVGRVARPHGVRGELKVGKLTTHPEHLADVKTLYVGPEQQPYRLVGVRSHKNALLIKLEGVTGRDEAEAFRGAVIYVSLQDAVPLETDEYYEHQILGLTVETDTGERLGEVVETLTLPGANEVLVVHGSRGELLIPVTEEVVVGFDLEEERIVVHPLPGLLKL
jgi:16S rRNA processing protein RimM